MFGHAVAVEFAALERQAIAPAPAEFGCGDIERDRRLPRPAYSPPARSPAPACPAPPHCCEGRPPAAFVGHALQQAALGHDRRRPRDRPRRSSPALRQSSLAPRRHDHEILNVGAPAGMRAAAKNLDLRQRHADLMLAGEIAPQRQAARSRRPHATRPATPRPSHCRRAGFVGRAVERDQPLVDRQPGRTDRAPSTRARFHRGCLQAPSSHQARPTACRRPGALSPRGNRAMPPPARCRAHRAVTKRHFGLDGRPPARIPDAAGVDILNGRHDAAAPAIGNFDKARRGGTATSGMAKRRTTSFSSARSDIRPAICHRPAQETTPAEGGGAALHCAGLPNRRIADRRRQARQTPRSKVRDRHRNAPPSTENG